MYIFICLFSTTQVDSSKFFQNTYFYKAFVNTTMFLMIKSVYVTVYYIDNKVV